MALIKENGTGVDGANSFATLEEIRSFALERGVTLSTTDSVVESLAIRAMDFIFEQEPRMQGTRVDAAQALPFPRTGVVIYGAEVPEDVVPDAAINLQCAAVLVLRNNDLQPVNTGQGQIIRKKIGEIEYQYAQTAMSARATSPLVEMYLRLLTSNTVFPSTIRV